MTPQSHQPVQAESQALRTDIILTGLTGLGLVLGVLGSLLELPPWTVSASWLLAYLAGGLPAGWEALKALAKKRLEIDLLMVLAALAAAAVGEARDGAILLFLFSLASTLEAYAMGRTKHAVQSLMQLRPDSANRRLDNEQDPSGAQTERVPVELLELGDRVIIKPGERVPVDGVIRWGHSAIDQATITGESMPVDKAQGDQVFASTINGYGVLEVTVTKRASESTLARMITLVTEAQASRSPSQRFSDWFGERYTAFVLLGSALALGVFLLLGMPSQDAFYRAATLLVVASPCAVVISVPAAVLSALAAAGRGGVLFKGGAALEDFGNATLLALDKTGTLTEGKPAVTDIWAADGDQRALLGQAAALEAHSEHPIAQSILSAADARRAPQALVQGVQALPGHGVVGELARAQLWAGNRKLAARVGAQLEGRVQEVLQQLESSGKTPVLVGRGERVIGVIGVADTVRVSAKAALDSLRAAGLQRTVMLSGDHASAAQHVGRTLGFASEDVVGDLLPEDKVRLVQALRQQGKVAFVGDGVNDAAALASAHVGVAMGTAGSDVALEAADVALLSDDLSRLTDAYLLARRANRVVKQNLTFALSVMAILVLFTLFAELPLPLGVLGHEGGTLIVVMNGLRLLFTRRARAPHSQRPEPAPSLPASRV